MAVGLAIFLPTAWAKGCRAPCGKNKPESLEGDRHMQRRRSAKGIAQKEGRTERCREWKRKQHWDGRGGTQHTYPKSEKAGYR